MKVYLVRHGETDDNRRHIHQPHDAALSKRGVRQSQATAEMLRQHGVEKLIASDFNRTTESAEIIGEAIGLPVEHSTLWREVHRPSVLDGKSHYHPRTFEYVLRTILNRNNRSWHYRDAESLFEIHRRAEAAETDLARMHRQHKAVAIVTHAIFLEIFVTFMCKRGKTGIFDYFPIFSPFSVMKNGSLTVLEHYDTEAENVCTWGLELFNDVSHLRS